MNKKLLIRWIYYLCGMVVLALGLILNTKSNMGASAIISVAYTASFLCKLSFADLTLIWYIILVALEFVIKGKERRWTDILQIPLSIVFTRFMNLFSGWFDFTDSSVGVRFVVLILGIVFTGIGAAWTVDMDLIANPGDGFVQAVAMRMHKGQGTAKNFVDFCCVALSLIVGWLTARSLLGVGIGTILAMVGVGRVIALFNHLFLKKITEQALPTGNA